VRTRLHRRSGGHRQVPIDRQQVRRTPRRRPV
jgi:hypothetical protein